MTDTASPENRNFENALRLAALGFYLFPQYGKIPKVKWGSEASNNPARIEAWARKFPNCAFGINTGMSGLVVIDCDKPEAKSEEAAGSDDELDGVKAFGELCQQNGWNIDKSPLVATPSGGSHVYFRQPEGEPIKGSSGSLPKWIEVKGKGKCITAPGSFIAPNEKYPEGAQYELTGDLTNIPMLPNFLKDIILEDRFTDTPITGSYSASHNFLSETSLEEIRELLYYIDPDLPYGDWVQALMALHSATGGSGAGLTLADEWSSQGQKYKKETQGEIKDKWRGFRPGGVGKGTLAKMAQQYGADLAEIGSRHYSPPPSARAENDSYFQAQRENSHIDRPEQTAPLQQHDDTRGQAHGNQPPNYRAQQRRQGNKIRPLESFDDISPILNNHYIVKNFLDHGTMSVVYGASNSGKTFFALDLTFHIAAKPKWRGRRVDNGGVLYLAAEGGSGIINRIAALKSEQKTTASVPFFLERAGLDLLNKGADTDAILRLAEEVERRCGLSVIVVDTLSRVMAGGDENSAQDMTLFIKNIDKIRERTRAHIMIIHHTGKDGSKGARGHSSLRAATDTEIEVSAGADGVRAIKVQKQREYSGEEEFWFRLKPIPLGIDADGDQITSCVVVETEAPEGADGKDGRGAKMPETKICKAILEEIDKAWKEGRPFSPNYQARITGRYAFSYFQDKYNVRIAVLKVLFQKWKDSDVIDFAVYDKKRHKQGLKKTGEISKIIGT